MRIPLLLWLSSATMAAALAQPGVMAARDTGCAGHGGPEFQDAVARAMVLAFLDERLKAPRAR